ncbi:MAG TPA: hypothetical protein VNA25_23670 [Phycisphaerae bacterium]|nr:hypothetical protein [Phycisphaerae bacterium]
MDERLSQTEFEDLSAYLDGELTGEALRRVEAKLAGDAEWQRALRRLQALDRAIGVYNPPGAPADLAARVIDAVARARRPAPQAIRIARWLIPAAAAAAIILGVLIYKGLTGPETEVKPGRPTAKAVPVVVPENASISAEELAMEHADFLHQSFVAAVEKDRREERFTVENLDFFRDYDVLSNIETIEAIDALENQAKGT